MPELPEVEVVCRGLRQLIVGQSFIDYKVLWHKSFALSGAGFKGKLFGHGITGIRRLGKMILLDLDNQLVLAVHLRMTGQLVYVSGAGHQRFGAGHPSDSLLGALPDSSTRVWFGLSAGRLFFNDQRKFGRIELLTGDELAGLGYVSSLGVDALDPGFDAAGFLDLLRRYPRRGVKAALLDQRIVAGTGNIYADEALWGAGVYPGARIADCADERLMLLWAQLREVMQRSIAEGGSTDRNYVDAEGRRGAYLDFARVYRRTGLPCRRCGALIQKMRCAGRGTHFCPCCQPAPDGV